MAVRIQLRRGNNSEFDTGLVLTAGEVALVEDEKVLIVGDGTSTYNDLKGAGKFINYQTREGLGVVGGANATGETPLTVKGVGSQTAAILKVTDSGDSAILQIFDDEGPTVRLEDHGDTNEVFMLLKQQASGTANALELKDSADTDQMTISCDGEVAITPTNNQTADAPSLDVKGSGANNSGIFRVKDSSDNAVLTVKSDGVESEQTVTVDGGSIIAQVEDDATSNVTITASATDSDKVITVDGNGGTENFSVTAGGAIATNSTVTAEGKGTFADADIDVTGRTLTSASLVRLDEILGLTGTFTFTTDTPTDGDYNGSTEHLLPLDIASAPHDFATKTTFPNQPDLTLVPISGTSASPDTSGEFGTGIGDTTNAYLLRIPANSGRLNLKITLTSGQVGLPPATNAVGGVAKFYSYTAQTATSSDNKTQLGGDVATLTVGDTTATVTGSVNVANSTVEKFVAVSFDANHNTSGTDVFSYTFEVSRDGETVVAL